MIQLNLRFHWCLIVCKKNQDYHSKIESDQIKTSTLSMSSYVWQHSIKMTWLILNFNECLTVCKNQHNQLIGGWLVQWEHSGINLKKKTLPDMGIALEYQ